MKHSYLVYHAAVLALMLCGPAVCQDSTPVKAAASVNGKMIPYDLLLKQCVARHGAEVLENLILVEAIEQAAQQAGVSITLQEVDERCAAAEKQIGLRAPVTGLTFAGWLRMQGMSPASFRQGVYLALLVEKMVKPKVSVSDEDVSSYYTRNRERLRQPERVKVAHICVASQEKAQQLRDDILAGRISFADAAKDNSVDPYTKDNGGEWGFIVPGNDPFQTASFALTKDGEISPVVESKMGFHVIKRLERMPARIPPFEELQDRIRAELENEALDRLAAERRAQIVADTKIERYIVDFSTLPSNGE